MNKITERIQTHEHFYENFDKKSKYKPFLQYIMLNQLTDLVSRLKIN